ncbi:response regulator [Halopseudomonas pelagia]|uniref:response regulator n=1 Tax=Halopseudomonas pelagia TaxID=553151 RepID=UPI0026ADE48F
MAAKTVILLRRFQLLKKVLLVEDEMLLAENLKLYLEKLPCEVHLAADGISGIQLARTLLPEVIVLDYRLPDMEGFQVLDTLEMHWQGGCILITGHPSSQVLESAKRRRISHIMFKPFPLEELRRLVSGLLETPAVQKNKPMAIIEERRRERINVFPLRMYDGSWVMANRRQPLLSLALKDGLVNEKSADDGAGEAQ